MILILVLNYCMLLTFTKEAVSRRVTPIQTQACLSYSVCEGNIQSEALPRGTFAWDSVRSMSFWVNTASLGAFY